MRPDTVFNSAATDSATPSMTPTAATGAPSTVVMKSGISGYSISDDTSAKNDTSPSRTTFGVSARRQAGAVGASAMT